MTDQARYEFLPWVRSGFQPNVETDNLSGSVSIPGEVSVAVNVVGEGTGVRNEATATTNLRLYGPGDVTGIDERQVVRREPEPATTDFPPNYFPMVEFDRPDLPWLFSPATPNATDRLRPWLCLVVIRDQDGVEIGASADHPRPVLTIKSPANPAQELPDLSESWAWAHAQVVGDRTELADDEWIQGHLSDRTPTAVSRLVASRRLNAEKRYFACVVPTFDAGVAAGLGAKPSGESVGPAWTVDDARIDLPVYVHWQFSTGPAGDFEALVKRIEPAELSPDVGYRDLNVSDPGPPQLVADDSLVMSLGGALRSTSEREETYPENLRDALQEILNAPNVLDETTGVPIVGPPIYGRWHAASMTVPSSGEEPAWVGDLNLDPRTRVAAGLGTDVVQNNQEALMASAWEQVGEIREANQLLIRAQLARGASATLYENFADEEFNPFEQLLFTSGVHTRLLYGNSTVAAHLADRRLPNTVFSPTFRRCVRPNGPFVRRLTRDDRTLDVAEMLQRLNEGVLSGGPTRGPPDGLEPLPGDIQEQLCSLAGQRLDESNEGTEQLTFVIARLSHTHEKSFEDFEIIERELEAEREPDMNELLELIEVLYERCDEAFDLVWEAFDLVSGIDASYQALQLVRSLEDAYISVGEDLLENLYESIWYGQYDEALDTLDRIIEYCETADKILDSLRSLIGDPVATHLEPRLCEPPTEPELPPADVPAIAQTVVSDLDPEVTVPTRVLDRIDAPRNLWDRADPLTTVMAAPEFPQPMYRPLADRSQAYLLPGVDQVPADSMSLMETNPEFIVAYLAGCNHEFARELLWRGYPTDQRGSYFRQFWDVSGRVPAATTDAEREARKDVDYLPQWPPKNHLGQLLRGDHEEGDLVLLVRGELLRRYPDARIYAIKARWKDDQDTGQRVPLQSPVEGDETEIRRPIFRGELNPDVTFLGFSLTKSVARGDDDGLGWFFVLEEPPAEPRLGLEEASETDFGSRPPGILTRDQPEPPDTNAEGTPWDDLSWGHLIENQGEAGWSELERLSYVSVGGRPLSEGWHADGIKWGTNSAHMAAATWQRPVRVAIHANDMLPAKSE